MLKIENLSFKYPGGILALKDINIDFPKAHILAVLGRSGSGKTTLLRCIGRFLKPSKGTVYLREKNIYEIDELEFRRSIGIVFQNLYLFPHLTVLENLMLAPTKVMKKSSEDAKSEAMETLERLGVGELAESYPSQISGGQAQRAAIARALLLKPEYLLLDEPTSALDLDTTNDFADWLVDLKAETTFIVVTHDIPFASRVATSGVLLEDGKINAEGSIEHILKNLTKKND